MTKRHGEIDNYFSPSRQPDDHLALAVFATVAAALVAALAVFGGWQ
jgi:hypothetical protein